MTQIREKQNSWQDGIAKNITFIVTKDCQLACKYCYLTGKTTYREQVFKLPCLAAGKTFVVSVHGNSEFRQVTIPPFFHAIS